MDHERKQPNTAELLARIEELETKLSHKQRWYRSWRGRIALATGLAATLVVGPSLASLAGAAPPVINWTLIGNAGTNPNTNYIGTSDANGLSIRTNGQPAIGIDASQNVTFTKAILGNINGTAGGFTGTLSGDVTGGQGSTVVGKINGSPLGNLGSATSGNVLTFDGAHWVPQAPASGGLTSVAADGSTLSGDGTANHPLAVNTGNVQARVSGTCSTGSTIKQVKADGSVSCEAPVTALCPGCNLGGASLHNANLIGAYLFQADLANADLSKADLSNVNLIGANLINANFAQANFTGANLGGATWGESTLTPGTIWSNTTCPDLSNSDADGGTCVGHGF
jgi:uncharacterized protein YjbI with pentapeptide repeats